MRAGSFQITVQPTDEKFICREDEYVFDAMLRARCGSARCGCCGGGCGVCKALVLKGAYRQTKKMSRAHVSEQEQKEGFVLLCCIRPCADMTIMQTKYADEINIDNARRSKTEHGANSGILSY